MLIERILKEPGGARITFKDGAAYHFKPRESDGAHVAEVTDEGHVSRLLAIREGYRVASGADLDVPPGQTIVETITGEAQTNVTGQEPQSSDGATAQEDNGALQPTMGAVNNDDDPALEAQSDEKLREIFEAEVGRKPHTKAGRDTMIAQIEAARAQN
ncbi:MAG: hypothetical protein EP336_09475 [Rhodobacteraceae bacterium]|nr:MAG: hypothetical protein EP336_09475 [Paracoccaceae bacterium]